MLAGLLQNIILAGGFGITEAMRMAAKPNNLLKSTGFIALFSVTVTSVCYALDGISFIGSSGKVAHALIFALVLSIIYLAVLAAGYILSFSPLTIRRMSVCALNTLVLSLPYMAHKSAFTFGEALGTSIGAAIAYLAAVILLKFGNEKLNENTSIPEAFKGNGAMFIYTALLSLALAGITGARIYL